MAVVIERVADVGYEEDFAKYSQMKVELREKLEREMEEKFAEQSVKLNQLIELTSHEVEIEVAEEEVTDEAESVGE